MMAQLHKGITDYRLCTEMKQPASTVAIRMSELFHTGSGAKIELPRE